LVLKYKGFFKSVNPKPEGEWIEIFASDWNKDWFAFYAYISLENYEQDIKEINELISELNWMDGDVYVELINHSPGLKEFYHWLYEKGYYTHHCALDPENWRRWFSGKSVWKRCSNPECRRHNEAWLTRDCRCDVCGSPLIRVRWNR